MGPRYGSRLVLVACIDVRAWSWTLRPGELLLHKSANAKAEASVLLNGTWMCGGPSELHSASLLYLAMGLRLPCSEWSRAAAGGAAEGADGDVVCVWREEGGYDGDYWRIF
jgi:hypothetical protein